MFCMEISLWHVLYSAMGRTQFLKITLSRRIFECTLFFIKFRKKKCHALRSEDLGGHSPSDMSCQRNTDSHAVQHNVIH